MTISPLTVKEGTQIYHLLGAGWTRDHFERLKSEAKDTASLIVFVSHGNSKTVPIKNLEWDDRNDR